MATTRISKFKACTLPDGVKRCFFTGCGKRFQPRKADQRFCSPKCKADFYTLARSIGVKALESKGAHSARIGSSERLMKVFAYLSDGMPHTTRDILRACDVCAVNTIVSELRDNGYVIDCKPVKGKKSVYEYRWREGSWDEQN